MRASTRAARERLRPVGVGVDFLGYIARSFHLLVRRRVVGHLRHASRKACAIHAGMSAGWTYSLPDRPLSA